MRSVSPDSAEQSGTHKGDCSAHATSAGDWHTDRFREVEQGPCFEKLAAETGIGATEANASINPAAVEWGTDIGGAPTAPFRTPWRNADPQGRAADTPAVDHSRESRRNQRLPEFRCSVRAATPPPAPRTQWCLPLLRMAPEANPPIARGHRGRFALQPLHNRAVDLGAPDPCKPGAHG